jgi:ATP-dependent 26S proteasome regulatory subunit
MFHLCLNGRPCSPTIDFKKLAAMTENYVGSDLELVVTEAARDAVTHERPEIDEATLIHTLKKVTPSLTPYENRDVQRFRRHGALVRNAAAHEAVTV